MPIEFTENESLLFDKIYSGLPGDLPEGTPISDRLLRQAMLEIDSFAPALAQRRAFRWEIHNAVFDLEFDLRDASRSDGSSLPALEFIGCTFQSGFFADGARIERLIFSGCSFTAHELARLQPRLPAPPSPDDGAVARSVDPSNGATQERLALRNRISLRNLRIATELAFKNLHPNSPDDVPGILFIDVFAAVVGTNLVVSNCILRAPQGESSATLPEPRYALDISTAKIGCDFHLMPHVVLEGGLKARDARIGGSLWASGLRTTDGESEASRALILAQRHSPRYAFRLETSQIEGNLMLGTEQTELERTASIFRNNPYTNSGMPLSKVKPGQKIPMRDTVLASSNFHCGGMISLLNSRIEGDLRFSPGTIEDGLYLTNAVINGQMVVNSPSLTGLIPPVLQALLIPGPLLVSDVNLDNARLNSACALDLESARVDADGATFGDRFILSGAVNVFVARGITVAGDLSLSLSNLLICDLTGAKVSGTLNLDQIGLISFEPRPTAIAQSPELSFYPGYRVTELLLVTSLRRTPRIGVVAFLTSSAQTFKAGGWKPIPLFGDAASIHRFNDGYRRVIFRSGRNREIAGSTPLVLETETQAREYLRFFCAFMWFEDDMGSFSLISEARDLPEAVVPDATLLSLPCERSPDPQKGRWNVRAYTRFGDTLYLGTFRIAWNGRVEMIEDEELARYDWSDAGKLSTFSRPYRYPPSHTLAPGNNLKEFRSDFRGEVALDSDPDHIAEIDEAIPGWKDSLTVRPSVRLRNASCKVLSDSRAKIWNAASGRIDINEFDYRSIDVTPEDFDRRLSWVRHKNPSPENGLKSFGWFIFTLAVLALLVLECLRFALQGPDYLHFLVDHHSVRFVVALTALSLVALLLTYAVYKRRVQGRRPFEFNAQPYAHLAAVLRSRGEDHLAKRVEAEKMWQEAQQRTNRSFLGMLSMIFWWRPYGVMFGYGLSPLRAASSLLVLWLLGWNVVSLLSSNQMLQASVTRLAPAALIQSGTPLLIVPAGVKGIPSVEIPCGDAIEPGLYSFELLTPILNLHQESRCEIHAKPNGNSMVLLGRSWRVPTVFVHAPLWDYSKALYMLIGSVVSSLALLTFSGIARRWEN